MIKRPSETISGAEDPAVKPYRDHLLDALTSAIEHEGGIRELGLEAKTIGDGPFAVLGSMPKSREAAVRELEEVKEAVMANDRPALEKYASKRDFPFAKNIQAYLRAGEANREKKLEEARKLQPIEAGRSFHINYLSEYAGYFVEHFLRKIEEAGGRVVNWQTFFEYVDVPKATDEFLGEGSYESEGFPKEDLREVLATSFSYNKLHKGILKPRLLKILREFEMAKFRRKIIKSLEKSGLRVDNVESKFDGIDLGSEVSFRMDKEQMKPIYFPIKLDSGVLRGAVVDANGYLWLVKNSEHGLVRLKFEKFEELEVDLNKFLTSEAVRRAQG